MSLNRGPKIITDGLVLCLDAADRKSYPGSGNIWYDRVRTKSNCTLSSGASFNSDKGGCIAFDGNNSGCSNSSYAISMNNAATISLWLKHTSGGTQPNTQRYFSIGNSERMVIRRQGSDFMFYVNTGSIATPSLQFLYVNLGNVLTSGEIFNLVSLWNGSSMIIYKNAVQIGSSNVTGTVSENYMPYYTSAPGFNEAFNGRIYTVMFYTKTLSISEITQNYTAQRGRFGI
jgi:hypothetical protein